MQWVGKQDEQKLLRSVASKMVLRWEKKQFSQRLFMNWVEQTAQHKRLINLLSKVRRRWVYGCLWNAWQKWMEVCWAQWVPTALKLSLDLSFESTLSLPGDKKIFLKISCVLTFALALAFIPKALQFSVTRRT